jgi:pyruvyl transferase EpsO
VEKMPIQLKLKKEVKSNDCFDWSDLLKKNDYIILRIVLRLIRVNKKLKFNLLDKLIFKIWNAHAEFLIHKMSKKFSSYEKIVTSRLHGHILSCLVGVSSSIIDNNYGKNTAYYELWTKDLGMTSIWDK